MASGAATRSDATGRPDPLDPVAAPFGTFPPPPVIRRFRDVAIAARSAPVVGRWLYKLLSHVTKKRGHVFDIEYEGVKYRVYLDENGHDRWMFRRGLHPEIEDLAVFDPHRAGPIVFVDIGANTGFYAIAADRALAEGSRIISFEPHPRTRAKLMANLAFNGVTRVEVEPYALGAEKAVMRLHTAVDLNEGGNTLHPRAAANPHGVEVDVVPLLERMTALGVERIDILKIDVEGYEDRVLAPFFAEAPQSLWPRVMLLEVTFDGAWETDLLALLKARGYRQKTKTLDNAWLELSEAAPAVAGSDAAAPISA